MRKNTKLIITKNPVQYSETKFSFGLIQTETLLVCLCLHIACDLLLPVIQNSGQLKESVQTDQRCCM